MIESKKKTRIIGRILALVAIILALFTGGYFLLDKVVVPKYFGKYSINNISDLVGVVKSLYKSPNESKFITNGYTQADLSNAIVKLQAADYKITDDGIINEENILTFKGEGELELTDREFAAVCNKLIENGMLDDALPNLNYLNVINISVLEVVTTPDEEFVCEDGTYTAANISFVAKIETDDIREQIAIQMETPVFLLNMIIPDVLYFKVSYDFDLSKTESERVSNGSIAINGRTSSQSEVLINLLIDFIFPDEDEMSIDKFTSELGNLALRGIDELGNFQFASNLGSSGKQNGVIVNPAK